MLLYVSRRTDWRSTGLLYLRSIGHRVEYRIHHELCMAQGDLELFCQLFRQFRFRHGGAPYFAANDMSMERADSLYLSY